MAKTKAKTRPWDPAEHLETEECSDDPNIIQFPPAAPLDTLIGVGTRRHNNVDGFTIEFTMQDYGEPGSLDQMRILSVQLVSANRCRWR